MIDNKFMVMLSGELAQGWILQRCWVSKGRPPLRVLSSLSYWQTLHMWFYITGSSYTPTLTLNTDIQTSHTFQAQLEAIYENYKVDFEMFNYSMDKYL